MPLLYNKGVRKQYIILLVIISLVIYFTNPQKIFAAKKFVRSGAKASTTTIGRSYIPSIVKYRSDKLGVFLSFANFNGLQSVNYTFTYNSNGQPQGAGGTITEDNNPTAQRELLFGTCSSGICTYHYNLTNASLILTAKMTNGKTISKRYRIKTYQ